MRTMESDVKSVKQSGGGVPEPELINPADFGTDAGAPIFKPETTTPEGASEFKITDEKPKTRRWLIWLFIIVLIAFVAALGYVYAWPLLFPSTPGITPTTEVEPTEIQPTDEAPVGREFIHQSFIGTSDELIKKLAVADYSVVDFLTALQGAIISGGVSGVEEVVFEANSMPINAGDFLKTMLPELEGGDLLSLLEAAFTKDFTTLLYTDNNGVWPIYVFKRSDSGFPVNTALLSELETASIGNLYVTPPTGNAAAFRSGKLNDRHDTRYAVYEQGAPAALNYALMDNYLVIATTYDGLKNVAVLLGLQSEE